MLKETHQTLKEQPPRSSVDSELVGGVLGDQAAEEMAELTDPKQKPNDGQNDEITMSGAEAETTKTAEAVGNPEKTKRDVIRWAVDISMTGEWIDKNLSYNTDGTVDIIGNLSVWDTQANYLPPGLYRAHSDLIIAYTNITDLTNLPKIIDGDLDLRNVNATSIPAGLKIGGEVKLIHDDNKELIEDAKRKGYNVNLYGV